MSLVFILILAMTPMVLMIPKAHSTGGNGLVANIRAPGPAPHQNDPVGTGPQGFLGGLASAPLPGVPPMVPGPASAPPYPFAGFIGPAAPQPLIRWSNEGGGVYFGPDFDVYFPTVVYDALGGGPYFLTSATWTGCDGGCEGWGPSLIIYSWDIDGDGSLEYYTRVYARDPGEITVTYESAVGGVVIPTDKFGLLAPYIGLASTTLVAAAATAIYVKRVKHRKEKR